MRSLALVASLAVLVIAAPGPINTVYETFTSVKFETDYVYPNGAAAPAPTTAPTPTAYCGSRGSAPCPKHSSCSFYPSTYIQDLGGICVPTKVPNQHRSSGHGR